MFLHAHTATHWVNKVQALELKHHTTHYEQIYHGILAAIG